MGKNVAVFVDVANIFYAAKAAGVDIDYVTLLKSATAGRDLVRAYAYTGLDPDNENQRNFHDFLRRSNYKVVSKDIRKYGDGKVKANLDIELVVDMMKTARNLDIAIVVSGDGDFAPAIRAVQEQGVRVEVISFRGNTSSDLMEVADQFTDIIQLARVEKGSRSGRRVADGDDLSMTEVPDKQTEGTGAGRGRSVRGGRGRGRGGDAEPVAASASRGRGGRGRTPVASASNGTGGDAIVALPGEKLSRAGGLTEADLASAEVFRIDDLEGPAAAAGGLGTDAGFEPGREDREDREGEGEGDGEAGRRRRRRGGRGRGRGRSRDESEAVGTGEERPVEDSAPAAAAVRPPVDSDIDEDELEPAPAPRGPRSTPFGSVWDSQLGTSAAPAAGLAPLDDDEDFDEPEIPEYLIAEQRRGAGRAAGGRAQGGRGGARGGRSAYQSAMERERFGGGRSGGINRYPDVSGRTAAPSGGGRDQGRDAGRGPAQDRGPRRDDRPREAAPRATGGSEPWSEVPPELEAMLRAQVTGAPAAGRPTPDARADVQEADVTPDAAATPEPEAKAAPKRRTTRSKAATTDAPGMGADAVPADAETTVAPKRRTTRRTATATAPDVATSAATEADAEAPAAPKRRTTRKAAATTEPAPAAGSTGEAADAPAAPKRRTPRKTAATATPEAD